VKERPELVSLGDPELWGQMQGERRALRTENVGDFMPLVTQLAQAGEPHWAIVFSNSRSMPRSSSTIGRFVESIDSLMQRYPGEEEFPRPSGVASAVAPGWRPGGEPNAFDASHPPGPSGIYAAAAGPARWRPRTCPRQRSRLGRRSVVSIVRFPEPAAAIYAGTATRRNAPRG
jgi:hypothetical protein